MAGSNLSLPVISGFLVLKNPKIKGDHKMEKKFYIWKDPSCNGGDIEWLRLTGEEFFAMLKRAENKSRCFIRLCDDITMEADVIFIEATREQYLDWRKEQNAKNYLRQQQAGTVTLSLDIEPQESDFTSLYEAIADRRTDVEQTVLSLLAHETLKSALKSLDNTEMSLLSEIYVRCRPAAEIAREQGVHRSTVIRQVSGILKKLKKYF
jgi:RNA polymerase sigma factor (sigma-70 family)